jgi:phi13 family phage major tail protein
MARIGLKNFRYSLLDENEKVKEPKTLGKAIDCKVSLELNSAELYGDDGLCESDYTFNKGTVTITVDDDDDTILAPLLGHAISEDGEIVRKDTDVAPYIAFGRILTKIVGGVYKYKVEYLSKVKFKDTMPDEATKGESIKFTTVSIEGSVMRKTDGEWSKSKTFTTYKDASDYLDSLLTSTTNVASASYSAKSTTK